MNTIAIIISILILFIIGFIFLKSQVKKNVEITIQENEIKSPKVTYIQISKTEKGKVNFQDDYTFDISSITKRKNKLDILTTFQNNSSKHIRIEIIKTVLSLNGKEIVGDHQLKEMTMGTNDIILKNTILSGGNLIRNIYFSDINSQEYNSTDTLKIELLINNAPYTLENSFGKSTVDKVKVIEE